MVFFCLLAAHLMVGEEKKVLCQLLGKLFVPETVDDDKLRTLKLLIHRLRTVRLLCYLDLFDFTCVCTVPASPGHHSE
jgi:hypothetical protein